MNNADKLLLLEFNTGTNPFNYINSTTGNYKIECRCITSYSMVFNPSTTVTPECYLRFPQLTFTNIAITVDIDVGVNQNVECYFPGWQANAAITYTATAKLINEGSSFPPFVGNNAVYGGFYWIPSTNSLSFVNVAAPLGLSVSENPAIYSVQNFVNKRWTSAYTMTLTLSSGSIVDPIVYIDFQKGGFIPDQSICNSLSDFAYCRVYNTYRNIIVARFKTAISVTTVTFTKGSSDLLYPLHK